MTHDKVHKDFYSGTESLKGNLSVGRGAKVRRGKHKATHAVAKKRQKRRESFSEL
jgi:hypothetical protein